MSTASLEPHPFDVSLTMHGLRPRTLEVVATELLAPRLRRVIFDITDPEDFHYVWMSPDEHVKLFFPQPDTGEIVMPDLGPDGIVLPEDGPRPIFRDYTVRSFDAARARLTIDFVVHEHGVGGSWAATAAPGDRLGVLGPRGSHIYPTGYDWYLLGADETALPALARWLDELPKDCGVVAFVEVGGPDDEIDLPTRDRVSVQYVHRGEAEPGHSDVLEQAIRAYEFPDGSFFTWIAGEANTLKPIRRYLRRELGLSKERVKVDGYWRAGTVNLDHHEADGDDADADGTDHDGAEHDGAA